MLFLICFLCPLFYLFLFIYLIELSHVFLFIILELNKID
jgi:hypothetical protein